MRIAKHCCQGNETCYAVTVKDADLAQSLETKRTLSNTQKPFLLWDSSLTTFLFLAFFSWCHKHAFCSLQHHTLFKVSLASTALEHFRAVAAVSLLHFLYSTGTRHKCFKLKIQVDTLHFLSLLPVLIKRSLTPESPCTAGGQSVLRLPGHVSAYPCSVRRSVMFPSDL